VNPDRDVTTLHHLALEAAENIPERRRPGARVSCPGLQAKEYSDRVGVDLRRRMVVVAKPIGDSEVEKVIDGGANVKVVIRQDLRDETGRESRGDKIGSEHALAMRLPRLPKSEVGEQEAASHVERLDPHRLRNRHQRRGTTHLSVRRAR
jgi:hypothetical protein